MPSEEYYQVVEARRSPRCLPLGSGASACPVAGSVSPAWADLAAGLEELKGFGLDDPTIPDNTVAIIGLSPC